MPTITDGDGGTRPLPHDPGPAPYGHQLATTSNTYLRVYRPSDNKTVDIPLSGTGAGYFGTGGYFVLSALELTQDDASNTLGVDGPTFRNGSLHMIDVWQGTLSGTAVTATARTVLVQTLFDSAPSPTGTFSTNIYSLQADSNALGTRSGTSFTMDAHFTDTDNGLELTLHLDMVDSRTRPSATITSVSSLTPECTSLTGAPLTLSGSVSTPGYSSPSTLWTLNDPDGMQLVPDSTSASFTVPFSGPSSPEYLVTWSAHSGDLAATDTRLVRAVDTTPPTVSATSLKAACGWGQTGYEPNPQAPSLCTTITGTWADTCSAPRASISAIRVYTFPGNVLIESRSMNDGQCIAANPSYLNSSMSAVDYEIDWRARDTSGNFSTPVRRWRGYFVQGTPNSTCGAPVNAVTISDTNL